MGEGNGGDPQLSELAGTLFIAMREMGAALNRPEDDPDLETARRAMVRRWHELATADGSEPHWVLAKLLRAVDRLDAEDERAERAKRRAGRRKPNKTEGEMRAVPYPELDIGEVRAFILRRVNRSSLRTVGAKIGIGHSTLDHFVDGQNPTPRIRGLLCEYYLRENDDLEADVEVALELCTGYFPPEHRARVRRGFLDLMASEFTASRLPVPEWLERMRGG